MSEMMGDVPNVLMLRMLVLLICTDTGNSENGLFSMIVIILFHYLKFDFSAAKFLFRNTFGKRWSTWLNRKYT